MIWSAEEREKKSFGLSQVFKPATPIDKRSLFSGRSAQMRNVVDAINQDGQHVVMYGERGVGKTSLAKMLFPSLTASGWDVLTPHIFCDSQDDYASVWRKVFSEITIVSERNKIGFSPEVLRELRTVADSIGQEITPDVVRRVLSDVGGTALLVVILDEFDNLSNSSVRRLVADTVKLLSDRAVNATIVMIGVADDVDRLVENHRSIERCLVQVRMPRMSREELEQIVLGGLTASSMTIESDALQEVSGLSKGLPHYTHLLSLYAGRTAIDGSSDNITKSHVDSAVRSAIENTQQSIRSAHQKAVLSTKKNAIYDKVLLACAMAETDEWGFFAPIDVLEPMNIVMRKPYLLEAYARHLHTFCDMERGPVLKKLGVQHRFRFRFENALMQPYVLMRGMADRTITCDDMNLAREDLSQQMKLFKT